MSTETRSLRRRSQQVREKFIHGWARASDATESQMLSAAGRYRRAPAGTSLLLTLIVVALTGIGIVRVHSSTRVLALASEITELTAAQATLLDKRRRLGAERAYLRHPDQISEVALRLGMVPIAPDLVQKIRLMDAPLTEARP